jgi:PTH2 family peptidyl-tRNA hydrolase
LCLIQSIEQFVSASKKLVANLFAYLAQGQDKAEAQVTKSFKYKLAVAVRRDLDMGKGKIAVQVGHASVMASEGTRRRRPEWWREWFDEGQCKVVVKVNSESELDTLREDAEALGLVAAIIHDSGLTQVAPGTATCVGIGPAPAELVDKVTGNLPLL